MQCEVLKIMQKIFDHLNDNYKRLSDEYIDSLKNISNLQLSICDLKQENEELKRKMEELEKLKT